jgi:hypothetical protein
MNIQKANILIGILTSFTLKVIGQTQTMPASPTATYTTNPSNPPGSTAPYTTPPVIQQTSPPIQPPSPFGTPTSVITPSRTPSIIQPSLIPDSLHPKKTKQ